MSKEGLITGNDDKTRCWWPSDDDLYLKYHDNEWGNPVSEDRHLFEKLCLEGFQAGLSWITILRKRDNFRKAFYNFDYQKIAKMNDNDIERLLKNGGIIRHRGKIEAVINNAKIMPNIIKEFGSLASFIWQFEPNQKSRPPKMDYASARGLTQTKESEALSKALKKRGWKFAGPTTCYAFMQSMGLVNDHLEGCLYRPKIEQARKNFKRP